MAINQSYIPNKQEPLFYLIKSLTKAEKRNFKLYVLRQEGNATAKFVALFDVIDGITDYDEQKILKRTSVSKSQLPNMKAHLYRQILVSLRLLSVQHSTRMQLREQIDFARVLYDKGLYKQSLKVLDKAKKAALTAEQTTIALEIVEFEKNIETLHITRSATSRAEQLSSQTTELSERVENSNQLSNTSIQLYGLHIKLGYIRSERDLELIHNFFKPKIDFYRTKSLSFIEKVYLYQANMWYAFILHDFILCFKYSLRAINLFDANPAMRPLYYDLYLKSYSRYLETLFLTRNHARLERAIIAYEKDIEPVASVSTNAMILSHLALYIHKSNLILMRGEFEQGVDFIPKIEEYLKEYGNYIDMHYKLLFYYKIACIYFGNNNYKKCIEYLSLIINTRDTNTRRDLQCFARMLNLIASYELGKDFNLDYQIRTVYAFIIKMNDMHGVQSEIISFLKRLNHIYASDFKTELQSLYNKILPYEKHPYERRPFFYLDIISWLESKLTGKTVAEIVQQKFKAEMKAQ